ncbi:MAG TPA: MEDS domain-containing protein, partial [Chloroflexota bacterium]|nr:MEDS domain-containing protein [Chloroflexota bacterium]
MCRPGSRRALCVRGGEHDPVRVRTALTAAGVNVAEAEAAGALVLVTRWEVSFPDGQFDPVAMIAFVRETIGSTLASGFSGVRIVAEMTWALQLGVGHDRLIHYEADGNHLYPHEPLVAVCMYDRTRFPAAVWQDALRDHPVVALGERVYPNLYYEPPDAVTDGTPAAERVNWMLVQLQHFHEAETRRAVLQREQTARMEAEAAVRSRDEFIAIAAHELRTPLAGALGYTQMAKRRLAKLFASVQSRAVDGAALVGLREALDASEQEERRLERLIGMLLDTTRLTTGKLAIHTTLC